jgi:lysozyme
MANRLASSPKVIGGVLAAVLALAVPTITYFEGTRLSAYLDPVGIPTICSGETANVQLGQTMTRQQCDELTAKRVAEFAVAVDKLVTVPMPPARHAALTSFAYNVGIGAFQRSTLLRLMNLGQTRAACDQLMRWTYATRFGVRVQLNGLVKRRKAERELCLMENK